jgi:hypothetical protein
MLQYNIILLGWLALSHLRLIRLPFCRLLRLAGIMVEVFLPASKRRGDRSKPGIYSSSPPPAFIQMGSIPHIISSDHFVFPDFFFLFVCSLILAFLFG